jgi:hypothetical protein
MIFNNRRALSERPLCPRRGGPLIMRRKNMIISEFSCLCRPKASGLYRFVRANPEDPSRRRMNAFAFLAARSASPRLD